MAPEANRLTQEKEELSGDDQMRFKLTLDEYEAVSSLKAACEAQDVPYKSIFELAKYVLVSHSSVHDADPSAKAKRLGVALKRMKQRR